MHNLNNPQQINVGKVFWGDMDPKIRDAAGNKAVVQLNLTSQNNFCYQSMEQ